MPPGELEWPGTGQPGFGGSPVVRGVVQHLEAARQAAQRELHFALQQLAPAGQPSFAPSVPVGP